MPGINERVSVDSSNAQGNNHSAWGSLSGDGRFVVFRSLAANLVANDTNSKSDIFVRDRSTNVTTRVSVDSNGTQANGDNETPQISNDGRYVVFYSLASNLVANDTNAVGDVFLHDGQTGATQLVSSSSAGVIGNNYSQNPTISGDGRFVAFLSYSTNLASGTFTTANIFVKDLQSGSTTLLSRDASGSSGNNPSLAPSISCDGGVIAFSSLASNLVANDTNAKSDVFIVTRAGADVMSNITLSGNNGSGGPRVSCDGLFVTFTSTASNLVANDTNSNQDNFRFDRRSGVTEIVSLDSGGAQGNSSSVSPDISGDGRYVIFSSLASNLVSSDTNNVRDVFIRDMKAGNTQRLSVDSTLQQGNGASSFGSTGAISADGKYVSFSSSSTNLVSSDTNGYDDTFVAQTGF